MAELSGYIKLYRKLMQWGWYRDNVVKGLFLHCLLTAAFKPFDWMGREMKSGQLITTRRALADELGFTEQQVRTGLKKLESTGEIRITPTNKYTVITVLNWESYQAKNGDIYTDAGQEKIGDIYAVAESSEKEEQPTKKGVFCKQIMNNSKKVEKSTQTLTNKKTAETPAVIESLESENANFTRTLTINQPTNNQQITNKQPNRKNYKNNKNYKKRECARPRAREGSPSVSEIESFIFEEGLNVNGQKFFHHYEAVGWDGIVDWKAKVREWNAAERRFDTAEKKTEAKAYDIELFEKMLESN